MSRRALPILGVFLLWSGAAGFGAAGEAEIARAAQPIDEGVPQVAVTRLTKLAQTLHGGADAITVQEKLIEALVAAERPSDALRIAATPTLRDRPTIKFLRAQALAELSHYEQALVLYRQVANDVNAPQRLAATFGTAEMLRALRRVDEAIDRYRLLENDSRFGIPARLREAEQLIVKGETAGAKRILDQTEPKKVAERRERRLLRGRIELLNHRPDRTLALLESSVGKPGASRETVIATLFAIADAHLLLNSPESADDYLEDFIERHPSDPDLPQVFAKLDQVYGAQHKPSRNLLERWSREPAEPRRGFARWYLAQMDLRGNRAEDARRRFEQVRNTSPLLPVLTPALLQYARFKLQKGEFTDAVAILRSVEQSNSPPEIAPYAEFELARALCGRAQFAEAATHFETAARGMPHNTQDAALFNASLAWLQAEEVTKARADAAELARRGDTQAQEELALEQALAAAEHNSNDAIAMLQDFARRFPSQPRVSEAYVALAELAFHAAPPKIAEAERNLRAAEAAHLTPAAAERADYLAIWIADARGADSSEVITAATKFLRAHDQSPLAGEVRLKLAESHFRRQDFASAQTEFEVLAQQEPRSPLAEQAMFLAGQSAGASMTSGSLERALELFTEVVKMNGDLRWAARNEQAAIERRLGKPRDAQVLYEEVLKSDATPVEKREALCGEADISSEQATADPANLEHAIVLYDQLANEAAVQPHWRNQALFKEGVCLEKRSDPDAALATFYRILEFDPSPSKPPEFFWYYKAGFNAARLLEEQQKWDSAASVYQKLVAANGPRSEEAQARLTQLRLQHFLWQD